MLIPFRCTKNSSGIDILGNLTNHNTKTHMMNFHKYAAEGPPFLMNTVGSSIGTTSEGIVAATQNETADEIFLNPWSVLAVRKIPFALQAADFDALPEVFKNDTRIWKHDILGAFALMLCNVSGKYSHSMELQVSRVFANGISMGRDLHQIRRPDHHPEQIS